MADSQIINFSKLVESTVDDVINFGYRFLLTIFDSLFRPWRVVKDGFDNLDDQRERPTYIRPATFLIICLIAFSMAFDSARGIIYSIAAPVGAMIDHPDMISVMYGDRWYSDNFGLPLLLFLAPPIFGMAIVAYVLSHFLIDAPRRPAISKVFLYAAGLQILGFMVVLLWQALHTIEGDGDAGDGGFVSGMPYILQALLGAGDAKYDLSEVEFSHWLFILWTGCTLHLCAPFYAAMQNKIKISLYWAIGITATIYFGVIAVNYSFYLIKRHDAQNNFKPIVTIYDGKTIEAGREYELTILIDNRSKNDIAMRDNMAALFLSSGDSWSAHALIMLGDFPESEQEPMSLGSGKQRLIKIPFSYRQYTHTKFTDPEEAKYYSEKDIADKKMYDAFKNPFEHFSHMNLYLSFYTIDKKGNTVRRAIESGFPLTPIHEKLIDMDKTEEES